MHSSLKPTTPINAQSALTEAGFEGFTEVCFFAAFQPQKFAGNLPCLSRHKAISHNISHAVTYHGLIRSGQYKRRGRRYITVCRGDRQFPSDAMECQKCRTIQAWKDNDFKGSAHAGAAICLQCWCRFTKRELRRHLNGPSCPHNAEQGKSRKMMMLYTTFCSDSQPPTQPPRLRSEPLQGSRGNGNGGLNSRHYSAASPVTTTPTTLTIQPNEDLVWPFSLKRMRLSFILDPYDSS
ncbi:hypothetical protein MRS44_018212 [Fusarium solani]|uniref:uncharacterized protein n=1 Tax=Fusarium solani TaxID=169388 RepID=UPI0032C48975|nr:hypothetical protein MRS44_018212 [Fusarium solani]